MFNKDMMLAVATASLLFAATANAAPKADPAPSPAPAAAKEAPKVYAIVKARIRPGKYEEAVAFIRREYRDVGALNTGVRMVKSYEFQFGAEAGEIMDIWEAPDYNTMMRVFSGGPKEPTVEEGELFSSLSVQTAKEIPLDE